MKKITIILFILLVSFSVHPDKVKRVKKIKGNTIIIYKNEVRDKKENTASDTKKEQKKEVETGNTQKENPVKETVKETGKPETKESNVKVYTNTDSTSKGLRIASDEDVKKWNNSNRMAIVVGVNGYKSLSKLSFAVGDSLKMKVTLEQVGHFNKIVLLNDETGESDPKLLPTKANIEREFENMVKEEPSLLLFYFSGHGFMNSEKDNIVAPIDIVYKGEGNISDGVSITEFVKKSSKLPQALFFIDACREKLREGARAASGDVFGDLPDNVQNARGVAVMMGTKPGGYSYENPEIGGGVFTHFLLKGISGGVQNEFEPEYVTFGRLKDYVEKHVEEYSKSETGKSQIPYTAGDYTGNFLVSVGRPEGEVKSRVIKYFDNEKDLKYSRILYDTKDRILSQSFFIYGSGKTYTASDLDGISKVNIEYGKNQYNVKQYRIDGNIAFQSGASHITNSGLEFRYIEGSNFRKVIYDSNGNIVRSEEYSANGLLLADSPKTYINQIEYTGDKKTKEEFYSLNEEKKDGPEGIHRIDYTYNSGNELTRVEYYDAYGKLKDSKLKYAAVQYQYQNGKKTLEEYYNDKGKRVPDSKGIAKYVYTYDSSGRLVKEEYFDANENYLPKRFISIKNYEYDREGNLIKEENLNSAKDLSENSFGNAKVFYQYDSNNRKVREDFYNTSNKLKANSVASKVYTYDSAGNLLSESLLDNKGKLYSDRYFGISKYVYEYNSNSQKIREQYYSSEDKLKKNTLGIAEIKYEYDKSKPVKEEYFDENGEPCANKNGIYKKSFTYDSKGNKILQENFGREGNPKQDKYGIYKILYQYDDKNRLIYEENKNIEDNLKDDGNKTAYIRIRYDEYGRRNYYEAYNSENLLIKYEYNIYMSSPFQQNELLSVQLDRYFRPISFKRHNEK